MVSTWAVPAFNALSNPEDDMAAAAAASRGWTPPEDTTPIPPLGNPVAQFDQTLPPTGMSLPPAPVMQGGSASGQMAGTPGVATVSPDYLSNTAPVFQPPPTPKPNFLQALGIALKAPAPAATGTGVAMTQNPLQGAMTVSGAPGMATDAAFQHFYPGAPDWLKSVTRNTANTVPFVLGGEASLAMKAAQALGSGAGQYLGAQADERLGTQLPVIGGPLTLLGGAGGFVAPRALTAGTGRALETVMPRVERALTSTGAGTGVVPDGVSRTVAPPAQMDLTPDVKKQLPFKSSVEPTYSNLIEGRANTDYQIGDHLVHVDNVHGGANDLFVSFERQGASLGDFQGRYAGGSVEGLANVGRFLDDLATNNPAMRIMADPTDARRLSAYTRVAFKQAEGQPAGILQLEPGRLRQQLGRSAGTGIDATQPGPRKTPYLVSPTEGEGWPGIRGGAPKKGEALPGRIYTNLPTEEYNGVRASIGERVGDSAARQYATAYADYLWGSSGMAPEPGSFRISSQLATRTRAKVEAAFSESPTISTGQLRPHVNDATPAQSGTLSARPAVTTGAAAGVAPQGVQPAQSTPAGARLTPPKSFLAGSPSISKMRAYADSAGIDLADAKSIKDIRARILEGAQTPAAARPGTVAPTVAPSAAPQTAAQLSAAWMRTGGGPQPGMTPEELQSAYARGNFTTKERAAQAEYVQSQPPTEPANAPAIAARTQAAIDRARSGSTAPYENAAIHDGGNISPPTEPALTPEQTSSLDYFTRATRRVLENDSAGQAAYDRLRPLTRFVSGDVANSKVAELISREAELRSYLGRDGVAPDVIDRTVKAWQQQEIAHAFRNDPQGLIDARQALSDRAQSLFKGKMETFDKVQEAARETALSLDFSVVGQQVEASLRRGSVPTATGIVRDTVNRIANAMHAEGLGKMLDVYPEANLDHVKYAIADGLQMGGASTADIQVGRSAYGSIPKIGPKVQAGLDTLAKVQYQDILGTIRLRAYEGLLLQNKIIHTITGGKLGGDIADPLVRRHIAEYGNMIGSTSRTASDATRAMIERRGALTAKMTRASINEIVTPLRTFRSQEDVVNTLNLVGSVVAVLGAGKALNDKFGVAPFVTNPLAQGFGNITTNLKDRNGRNLTVNIFPQASLPKAILSSAQAIKAEDWKKLGTTWEKYGYGRLNVIPQDAVRAFGHGYDKNGYYSTGDLSTGERIGGMFPVPLGARSLVNGQNTPAEIGMNTIGQSNFPESDSTALRRTFAGISGQNYDSLLPSERQSFIDSSPGLAAVAQRYQDSRATVAADIGRQKATTLAADAPLLNTNPSLYRKAVGDAASEAAIKYEQAKADGAIKPFTGPQDAAYTALDGYYNALSQARDSATGQVDYAKMDKLESDYLASLDPAMAQRIVKETTFSTDPTYRAFNEAKAVLAPYFNARDQAWSEIASGDPQLSGYSTFDAFRDDMIAQVHADGIGWTEAGNKVDAKIGKFSDAMGKQADAMLAENADQWLPLLDKYDYYIPARFQKYVRKAS